jgi:hypothetical protein
VRVSDANESDVARRARLNHERNLAIAATRVEMVGVREYGEGYPVTLHVEPPRLERGITPGPSERRYVIRAVNEGGHNSVLIDLFDLLAWLGKHPPESFGVDALEMPVMVANNTVRARMRAPCPPGTLCHHEPRCPHAANK